MGQLDGKVAIVTGATSGIGERITEVFVAEGARAVGAGRREAEGRALEGPCGPALSLTLASAPGLRGGLSGHLYSASKAAVVHLSRNVASHISRRGVPVNTISPGGIVIGIFAKSAGLGGAKVDRVLGVIVEFGGAITRRVRARSEPLG